MQIKIAGTEEGPHLWPKRLPFSCLCFLRHKQLVTKLIPCQIKYHRYILDTPWKYFSLHLAFIARYSALHGAIYVL